MRPAGETRDRAGRDGDHRDPPHGVGDDAEARRAEDRLPDGAATAPAALHTAAAAFEHPDEGDLVLHGEVFGVHALAQARCVRGSALQGEILAADHDAPILDLAEADDVIRGDIPGQAVVVVIVRDRGRLAVLLEGVGVEEGIDALADRQPATGVLLRDAVLAALLLREMASTLDLADFLLPAHGC